MQTQKETEGQPQTTFPKKVFVVCIESDLLDAEDIQTMIHKSLLDVGHWNSLHVKNLNVYAICPECAEKFLKV